jgi:Transcriptional regulators
MITLKEIAGSFGCSIATVSKALNHMPDISPETAEQIRTAAAQMGYLPNAAARTLKTKKSRIIGIMVFLRNGSIWEHEFFSAIAANIQAVMAENGYDITPISCSDESSETNYLDYCHSRGYDGAIIISGGFISEPLMHLVNGSLPLVSIEYAFKNRSSVQSDNMQGMREIVRYAYENGHRRIAFIHGEYMQITKDRIQSFIEACTALDIALPNEYIRAAAYHDFESNAKATRELMGLEAPPTCIIYPDDYSCVGGMGELQAMGYAVPKDISVAGYDGIRLADIVRPRLTTFRQDSAGIGQSAAKMLLKAIEKPRGLATKELILKGEFIPGESIVAPNPEFMAF